MLWALRTLAYTAAVQHAREAVLTWDKRGSMDTLETAKLIAKARQRAKELNESEFPEFNRDGAMLESLVSCICDLLQLSAYLAKDAL